MLQAIMMHDDSVFTGTHAEMERQIEYWVNEIQQDQYNTYWEMHTQQDWILNRNMGSATFYMIIINRIRVEFDRGGSVNERYIYIDYTWKIDFVTKWRNLICHRLIQM